MKKYQLIDTFNFALEFRKKYIGVVIEKREIEETEIVISSYPNIAQNMAYYMSAYNNEMELKSYDGVRIIRVAAADTMEKIIELLEDKK